MNILVLSDSHAGLSFMRRCIRAVRPDAVIHLGDYFDDALAMAEENPHIVFHQVPGNCDVYRCPLNTPQVLNYTIGGVWFFMTHGHRYHVKMGIGGLMAAARQGKAQVVLYGHTHQRDCHREEDGTWVLNPGSCGSMSGSAGVVRIENGQVTDCRLVTLEDLEEMQ